MSLAVDIRPSRDAVGKRDTGAPKLQAIDDRVGAGVRRSPPVHEWRAAEPAPTDAVSANIDLLDRTSKSVVSLLSQYHQLQDHVRQLDAWSNAQIQAAEAAATHARTSVAEMENRLQILQTAFEAMKRRAEIAEQALDRDSRSLEALQGRIIAAFGFGSEAHDGLAPFGVA